MALDWRGICTLQQVNFPLTDDWTGSLCHQVVMRLVWSWRGSAPSKTETKYRWFIFVDDCMSFASKYTTYNFAYSFWQTYCLHLQGWRQRLFLRNVGIFLRVYTTSQSRRTSSSDKFSPHRLPRVRIIWILSSHLDLGRPDSPFRSGVPDKMLRAFVMCHTLSACPFNSMCLSWIIFAIWQPCLFRIDWYSQLN
jgi:hypothetical protein